MNWFLTKIVNNRNMAELDRVNCDTTRAVCCNWNLGLVYKLHPCSGIGLSFTIWNVFEHKHPLICCLVDESRHTCERVRGGYRSLDHIEGRVLDCIVISVYHSLQGNVFELEHPLICSLVSDSLHTYVYMLVCTGRLCKNSRVTLGYLSCNYLSQDSSELLNYADM